MKQLFLSLLILLAISSLQAQKLYVGGKFAGGITRLPNKDVKKQADMPLSFGYSMGGYCGITFTERLKFQGELLFSAINQKYEGTSFFKDTSNLLNAFDYKSVTKLKNIDIPVVAILGKWIYVEGGVCFNILLTADINEVASNWNMADVYNKKKEDISSHFQRINLSLVGGGGISMMILDHFGFNAGLRGFMGVNDFGSSVNTLNESLKSGRTGYWSLMINAGARYKF